MNPRIFGRGGGSSRIFSLTEIAFNMGLMLGPALCGSLSDAFGFYYMSCALAAVSAFMATISFMFFTHKTPPRKPAVNA
jgi:predicted MFS family arabinose efflux permease